MDGDQISSLIAPTPTGSVPGGGGRDDTVWWCMRCMTVPRMFLATYSCSLVYCSLLFPRRPSPRGACSAAQVQQHRIHPRHRHPPRSAAPPKRTLARCRASRRAVRTDDGWVAHPHSWSKFSFPHLMLTSVAMRSSPLTPCKAPAKRAEQGSAH